MKVFYGINKIKKYPKPVVALGVFDGVHRGHINILKAAVKKATAENGTSMVLTFWPHPQREASLYSLTHRLRLFSELGINVCIVISFSKSFAKIGAEDFIKNILFKKIRASSVYVGENFRFGKNAEGGPGTLKEFSRIYNYKLRSFRVIKINNKPISSTQIRNLIRRGRLVDASKLLTRPVSILGTVIKGIAWGRKLGFPTANIDPHHEVIPPPGVYAARVVFENKKYNGACYIGPKPKFLALNSQLLTSSSPNIEVYIYNFHRNIYGKYLEIQFIKKMRNRKKFSSKAALTKQIQKDLENIRTQLSRH